jgi:hypothetical protein
MFPWMGLVMVGAFYFVQEKANVAGFDRPFIREADSAQDVAARAPVRRGKAGNVNEQKSDAQYATTVDAQEKREGDGREENERRGRLFILMLQLLRAPK